MGTATCDLRAALGDARRLLHRADDGVFPVSPFGARLLDHQAACSALRAASRSATVAFFRSRSISATPLIACASARAKPTPSEPAIARSNARSAASTFFSAE